MRDTIHTRLVSQFERLWPWCRRHPILITLVAAVLLTGSIGLTCWLVTREADQSNLDRRYSSDLLLADQALQETNLDNATELLRDLQTALQRWPGETALWRARGVVLQRTGSLAEALAHLSKAIELASNHGDEQALTDALLRRRDLLRQLNRGAEAGLDERRARKLPYEHIPTNALPNYEQAEQVSVEFGETIREAGLYVTEAGDSKHTPATLDGQEAWFFQGGWNYAYFFIDPTFKWKLGSDAIVRVEYQILGRNPMGLHHDGIRGAYSDSAEYRRGVAEPAGAWRMIEFHAQEARFQNSQNGRADFRIHDNEKGFYLKRVTVIPYRRSSIRPREPSASSNQVDLTTFYNASARHYMPGGNPDAATNVLRTIRMKTGVEFDARGYIGLSRRGEGSSPDSATGIAIGRRVSRLHFLHSASYGETDGQKIGFYLMHMSDGSEQELAIIYGRNVRTERGDYKSVPEAEVAWEGEGRKTGAGTRVRIYRVTWINPRPDLEVSRIDFVSMRTKSAPHLLAITVE